MSKTVAEIATQPALWRRAEELAPSVAHQLPAPGEDVCVVGCGTSLYMAQAVAALRERAGLGRTDAYAASELPERRRYDVLLAISRSGTTSEITQVLQRRPARRCVALTALTEGPVATAADDVIDLGFADEESVVQTRFATTVLSLLRTHLDDANDAAAEAERVLTVDLPIDLSAVSQWTFLGRGWTVGLAQEAALKLRESAQAWTESYPALEYRHGPISVSGPGRVVWSLGPLEPDLAHDAKATGATVIDNLASDALAELVIAQRVAVALAERNGLDPDNPRNLSRSVVLSSAGRGQLS